MKYAKQLQAIKSGSMTRAELFKLRENALARADKGDDDALVISQAILLAKPKDAYVVFMGFCPGADFSRRQDVEWKQKGICTFHYLESKVQLNRFNEVLPGDLVVLKKRETFGETMSLYGHGRVTGIAYDEQGRRYLEMNWSDQETIIEVPLMGANSTIDVRDMARVVAEMPETFFSWLGIDSDPQRNS